MIDTERENRETVHDAVESVQSDLSAVGTVVRDPFSLDEIFRQTIAATVRKSRQDSVNSSLGHM